MLFLYLHCITGGSEGSIGFQNLSHMHEYHLKRQANTLHTCLLQCPVLGEMPQSSDTVAKEGRTGWINNGFNCRTYCSSRYYRWVEGSRVESSWSCRTGKRLWQTSENLLLCMSGLDWCTVFSFTLACLLKGLLIADLFLIFLLLYRTALHTFQNIRRCFCDNGISGSGPLPCLFKKRDARGFVYLGTYNRALLKRRIIKEQYFRFACKRLRKNMGRGFLRPELWKIVLQSVCPLLNSLWQTTRSLLRTDIMCIEENHEHVQYSVLTLEKSADYDTRRKCQFWIKKN